jgi:pyruvate dehydrogenase E2 component (dihydrolipoamide acetyltransferase)
MATTIKMPKLGMSMTKGVVVQWLAEQGAALAAGDPLVEVQSDKITFVVEATDGGTLHRVGQEGDTFGVGATIGYILVEGEEPPAKATTEAEPAATSAATEAEVSRTPSAPAAAGPSQDGFVRVSPLARRLAGEHGVDLALVTGSGPGGRIVKDDILNYVAEHASSLPEPEVAAGESPAGEDRPLSAIRQAVARRMTASVQTAAQVSLFTEIDATAVIQARQRLQRDFEVSYHDLIIQAVARVLPKHPYLNASLVDNRLRLHTDIHIGLAVALDEGLIVPVIRHADSKPLSQIARESRDLANRARSGQLQVDETNGSTFTITNLGAFGIDGFTPIINPPEAAILGMGRVVNKPAAFQGMIALRPMMTLSLTFDHRIVDGAPAAAFLSKLADQLQAPW